MWSNTTHGIQEKKKNPMIKAKGFKEDTYLGIFNCILIHLRSVLRLWNVHRF